MYKKAQAFFGEGVPYTIVCHSTQMSPYFALPPPSIVPLTPSLTSPFPPTFNPRHELLDLCLAERYLHSCRIRRREGGWNFFSSFPFCTSLIKVCARTTLRSNPLLPPSPPTHYNMIIFQLRIKFSKLFGSRCFYFASGVAPWPPPARCFLLFFWKIPRTIRKGIVRGCFYNQTVPLSFSFFW